MDVSRPELQELGNEGKIVARIATKLDKVNFYTYRLSQKLVHMSYPDWVPPGQFSGLKSWFRGGQKLVEIKCTLKNLHKKLMVFIDTRE